MILTDRHKCLENSINGDSVVAQSKLGAMLCIPDYRVELHFTDP